MFPQRHSVIPVGSRALLPLLCAALVLLTSLTAEAKSAYRELDWMQLLTKSDQDAMNHLPEIDHSKVTDYKTNKAWNRVLSSTSVVPALNHQKVKIAGYVVPLERDDKGNVTDMFLVPYYGACIHVPPPPPNQIIHVLYPKGFKLDALYTPFWVEGELTTESVTNDMASSSYSLNADRVKEYKE